jgi:hypothetical protein
MNMNQQQITGVIRIVLAAGTPLAILVAKYGINPTELQDWIIAGIPIVMGIWSWWENNHANQAKAAAAMPDVKVVAGPNAPASVQILAKDTSEATKNIIEAPPSVLIDKKVTSDAKPPGRGSSPR